MSRIKDNTPRLFDFAFIPNYDGAIDFLATKLAHKEPWSFQSIQNSKHPILRNYLEHTFRRIEFEKKVEYSNKNKYACFNTGLVTDNWEEIFAFFEQRNGKYYSQNKNQLYVFKAFIKKSDPRLLDNFTTFPKLANYFNKPEDLILNPTLDIVPQIDHIIEDNKDRFPTSFKSQPTSFLRSTLEGAITEVEKRIRTNYTIAIPQYFDNKIQLLLPLRLVTGDGNPDLALVVHKTKAENCYTARTCLTLEMAYNNARLIVKPHSHWLNPESI